MSSNADETVLPDDQDMQLARSREVSRLSSGFSWIAERDYLLLALAAFVLVSIISFLSLPRQYFNYRTETDFLGGFLPEAQRFLNSEPLELRVHPPAYPITVALLNIIVGDWETTGRLISLIAGVVVLICGYLAFFRLWGRPAAWGAALSLAGSSVFLEFASVSTSDMFFAALFWVAALLSLRAVEANTSKAWFLSGLFIGLGMLSRTNAVILIPFLLGAWLGGARIRPKLRLTPAAFCGLLLPLSVWAAYAAKTGSTFMPRSTHTNVALTYFAGDERGNYEGILKVEKFTGLLDVLLHDPARMAKVYVRDFARLMLELPQGLAPPLYLFFLPGLLLLAARPWSQGASLLLAVICLSLLVNNLRAFESRFYLYMLPLLGAGVGVMYQRIASAATSRWIHATLVSLLLIAYLASVGLAARRAHGRVYHVEQKLRSAIPAAKQVVEENAKIVARKRVVAHYVGADYVYLPEVDNIEDLHQFLHNEDQGQPLYLYFGSIEASLRPNLAMLSNADNAPEWLRPVASGRAGNSWVLYRYDP